MNTPRRREPLVVIAAVLAGSMAWGQVPVAPNESPVGHWLAEHPSTGGMGSWWEFRADGSFTMNFGVTVAARIHRSGNSFEMPAGTVGGAPSRVTYSIDGNTLHINAPDAPERVYTRIGAAPSLTDPLLGQWRPVPLESPPGADPKIVLLQNVMSTKGVLAFTPDDFEHFRVPLGHREGTWDAQTHVFKIEGDPGSYPLQRIGKALSLGQPGGKAIDTYSPDPLFE